jgi:hypothetical protein
MTLSDAIKKHEALIIVAVLLVAFAAGYTHVINWLDNRAAITDAKAQAALQVQIQQDTILAQQSAQSQATYVALVAKIEADKQQMINAQNKINQQTKDQQTKDQTLPPDQLAARWAGLVNQPAESIIPQTNSYTVSPSTATATVVQLEEVPELKSQTATDQQLLDGKNQQIETLTTVTNDQKTQIDGLNTEIVDKNKACQADLTKLKADNRKSKMKIAGIFLAIGSIAGRIFIP